MAVNAQKRTGYAMTCIGLTLGLTAASALAQSDSVLSTELVANGFIAPLLVLAPADDPRLFVVEQGGNVQLIKDGAVLPTPFLDITDRTRISGERGLLGMAFHPDYADNGFFYVNYINFSGTTVVARFSVDPNNPDHGDAQTEHVIIMIEQPFGNHNGGMITFGPNDGYLYIGMGDGGGANDPGNRAQDITDQLLGKMLRLDVDNDDFPNDPDANYAIPADNPFVGKTGDDEIWAFGLRNPWRFSFDRETADLWIADVGQSAREEVDFQSAGSAGGENYGWRCMEGFRCTGMSGCTCNDKALTLPIHEFSHNPHCSITGGYVYRGESIPLLRGTYFFADFCSNFIWSMGYDGNQITDLQERTAELAPGDGLNIRSITSFGEDADGNVYIVDAANGEVFRIVTKMQLDSTPLVAGKRAVFQVQGATPNAMVFIAYSIKGLGQTTVRALNVRLGIEAPKLLGQKVANGAGVIRLRKNVPNGTGGLATWIQALENGNTSNVIQRTIE